MLMRFLNWLFSGWFLPRCPRCGCVFSHVIYMGLPGKFCTREDCFLMVGPATWTARFFFNGALLQYEKGRYWQTLWAWLTGKTG